jgi:biopolymer transport protein ExbD
MASQKPSDRRNAGVSEGPGEPDLTPIMNLTFMLILALLTLSASVTLGLITIQAPQLGGGSGAASSDPEEEPEKKLNLSIFVKVDGFDLAASGASLDGSSEGREGQRLIPKQQIEGRLDYDFQELNRRLIEIKKNFRREQNVIIVGDQDVIYEDIVRTMDACRETADGRELFPAVAFSPGIVGG